MADELQGALRGLAQEVIETCREMNARGINQGTSGNVSVRTPAGMMITPSGVPYDRMTPEMLVHLPLQGPAPARADGLVPSTEWRFHQALMAARPDVSSVVHAHPVHCTALAMLRRPIPACHYMVAAFGGGDVPVAGYALFGSDTLSAHVVAAMRDRQACLMANHGALVVGDTLARALWRMEELETLARGYLAALSVGEPVLLSQAEIEAALAAFADYGLRQPPARAGD